MNWEVLSDDDRATLLLCSRLGPQRRSRPVRGEKSVSPPHLPEPLRDAAWHTLRLRLEQDDRRTSDLMGRSSDDLRMWFGWNASFAAQVAELLASEARRGLIARELEHLKARGIWVLSWHDCDYPEMLQRRLGPKAPPLLYGAGPRETLTSRGVAIVGSRRLDDEGERFAELAGERCSQEGLTVFSGAAWGADRVAMLAAASVGGRALGVVAGRLEQLVRDAAFAPLIADHLLTLISKVLPSAGFSVGNAMDRNALIYCLAERAVVVTSSFKSGGTWDGATKNLKRHWAPLYVRSGPSAPEGNRALIELGGAALPPECVEAGAWIREAPDDRRLL